MPVVITQAAQDDLAAIADFIARDNPDRAGSFIDEIEDTCMSLGQHPERYPIVPRYRDRHIRRRVHGNYLIFYRIEGQTIVILHVLHGAMDLDDHLF